MRRLVPLLLTPLFLVAPLVAQDPAPAPAAPPAMGGHAHAMGPTTGAGGCGEMCAGMMARMDSANAQITTLTDAMNKAKGDKQKVEAMTALLNVLVQQRLQMQSAMQMMHQHMEHMMHGGMGGMNGMAHCADGGKGCAPPAAPPAADKKE